MMRTKQDNLSWMDIDMDDVSLEKLLLHFSQCMKSDGKSPATIIWYKEMIPRFFSFVDTHGQSPWHFYSSSFA